MLEAKSVFYGGLLVAAEECNYDDYAKLGIVCPICNKAMFLTAAAHRDKHARKKPDGTTVQVKAADIPAHWNHFKDVDSADVDRCEARAKQITPTERLKLVAQARGQRERILSRNLWAMLQRSVKANGDGDDHGEILVNCLKRGAVVHEAVDQFYANMIDALVGQFAAPAQLDHTIDTLGQGMAAWNKLITADGSAPDYIKSMVAAWASPIDSRMHLEISQEVLRYLCTSRQRPILRLLVESAVFSWVLAEASAVGADMSAEERQFEYNAFAYKCQEGDPEDMLRLMTKVMRPMIGMDNAAFELLFYFVRDDIAQYCGMVSWADEIAKLQK
jgi:hypothetical protein